MQVIISHMNEKQYSQRKATSQTLSFSLIYRIRYKRREKRRPRMVISTTLKTKLMCEILSQRGGKEELETVIVRVLLQFLDYIWKGIKKKKTVWHLCMYAYIMVSSVLTKHIYIYMNWTRIVYISIAY